MRISLVVAAARNGVIGREGGLPWKLPDDQRFFRDLTKGHCIVIGRRTWNEIGKPLPDRKNLVVSRTPQASEGGVEFFTSLTAAIDWARAHGFSECFVAGGEGLYREALETADCVYLTRVDAEPEGDTWFPEIDESIWICTERRPHAIDARHAHAFVFERWERRAP
ncbi:dihydrofolate reductase [Myxococcota bacterium]|nr:dihydrofolate reductase [Myxococcota bacterium]